MQLSAASVALSETEGYQKGVHIAKPYAETKVKNFQIDIDPRIKDLAALTFDELKTILQTVNDIYTKIEKSNKPAAGYNLFFQVYAKNKRAIEVKLEAQGRREMNTSMAMPGVPKQGQEDCAFCKNTASMAGYEGASTEFAHVMMSQEKNPLTVSNPEIEKDAHYGHFFELPLGKQISLVQTAIKTVQIGAEHASRYWLICHIGVEGHQTFGHPHIHILKGLGGKEG